MSTAPRFSPWPQRAAIAASAAATIALATAAGAQEPTPPSVASPSSHGRLSFERVRFPGDGKRVGLVGTSYLVDLPEVAGLSLGPAIYGAVSGDRGGFFSLGGEIAWRQRLIGPVGIELGAYAGGSGGGGSGGAPRAGGLMLRPHADLVWDLGALALGVSVSRLHLSAGGVGSTQVGLVVNANSDFRFVPAARLGEPTRGGGRAGLGFDRVQFVGGFYRTPAGKLLSDGDKLPRSIALVGVRAEQSWGKNGFWGLEANRAGRGAVGGYAEYLGTVGVEGEAVQGLLTLGARLGAGMAGGGSVSTGGGLLAKASAYGIVRLSDDLGLAIEGGWARTPDGNFRAAQASAALVWALDGPASTGSIARPARTDFSAGAEHYDAARNDGGERALTAVVLRLDRYLTRNVYITGHAFSAAGGGAGGYSGAVVGAGWNQPLATRLHVGAELLAGAAGGGGVDGGGALFQPRVYAGLQLTPSLALRAGASRVKASDGRLDSTAYDLSLNVSYGVSAGN